MKRGPKGFSDEDKSRLRSELVIECERSWAENGYKKTSIGSLTSSVGISTGAFYLLYDSKEDLFCDTIEYVQYNLKSKITDIIEKDRSKNGFIEALKWHFNEHSVSPFLYDFNNPDFILFVSKLPEDKIKKMEFDSHSFFEDIIELSGLVPRFDMDKVNGVISTLLGTVTLKNAIDYDINEVFSFLISNTIDELFE